MSDMGRQSLGDKAASAAKPDSQKTYLEQAKDTIAGTTDSAASSAQPDSQKSFTQKAGDAVSGNQNQNSEGILDQAKNALGMNNNNPTK